ncbi:Pentatricopeptide repeat-containing protein [Forsythia ovata]|uniref:Pentatricopeptide repeat-containing protein n=1 Tax=Forsythia ovata TaxID=205694 RepID=A0ABD1WKG7_9LAMI
MFKHKGRVYNYILFSRTRRRPFSTCPLRLEPPSSPSFYSSSSKFTHKDLCFSLADQLINRGLLSSAQKVMQRLISKSSVSEAIMAVDFALIRGMELDLVSYGCFIRKLVTSGEAQMAEALYIDCIVGKGVKPDRALLNSMVICYCKLGRIDEGKSYFDRLIELKYTPCVGASDAVIRGFCEQDRILEGYDCFTKVSDFMLNYTCYNRLVDRLCFMGYLDEALHVFDVMMDRGVPPTVHLCKLLIFEFCKRGWVEVAESLSLEMESYGLSMDKVMYTYLIYGYCKSRKMKMAMRLFMRMLKVGCEPDNYTYNTLIHGYVHLGLFDKAWVLHNKMVNCGLKPNIVTYQIMISKYCKDQKVDCALMLLNNMLQCNIAPNVHCYTVLTSALCKEQRFEEVDSLYLQMLDSGIIPDHVLFFTLAKNHPKGDELHVALTVLQAIATKAYKIEVSGVSSYVEHKPMNVVMLEIECLLEEISRSQPCLADTAFSIYMTALCMGGDLDPALLCMDKMARLGLLPLLSAYNSLIKCFFQEGLGDDAKSVLEIMQDQGLVPNHTTLSILVNEFCKQGDLPSALDILNQIEERGVKPTVAIYNSILDCLGRHRRIFEAQKVFRRMLEFGVDPDETIFVTMINAYSKNGWANEARKLFENMLEYDLRPNSHAYTALITGFVKKNMTEKGCLYLDRMLEEGLKPNVVLYTSLMNQFLRKREFEFAFRLVDLMEKSEIEGDLVTYIALVSGVSRNIRRVEGKWYLSHAKSKKAKELMFNLLNQSTILPKENSLKILISSQEEMKFFALRLIQKIKNVPFMPNLYLYNGIISGLCWSGRMQEAYDHLNRMQREGVQPNQVTFTILIDGHIQFGETDLAVGLFNKMNASGFDPDQLLYNTLIRGLFKARRLFDALSLSHTMQKRGFSPSKISYENLLSLFCANQSSVNALRICEDMLIHDYVPCKYNLHWLISILCEDNKFDEACFIKDTDFDSSILQWLMFSFGTVADSLMVLERGSTDGEASKRNNNLGNSYSRKVSWWLLILVPS